MKKSNAFEFRIKNFKNTRKYKSYRIAAVYVVKAGRDRDCDVMREDLKMGSREEETNEWGSLRVANPGQNIGELE